MLCGDTSHAALYLQFNCSLFRARPPPRKDFLNQAAFPVQIHLRNRADWTQLKSPFQGVPRFDFKSHLIKSILGGVHCGRRSCALPICFRSRFTFGTVPIGRSSNRLFRAYQDSTSKVISSSQFSVASTVGPTVGAVRSAV